MRAGKGPEIKKGGRCEEGKWFQSHSGKDIRREQGRKCGSATFWRAGPGEGQKSASPQLTWGSTPTVRRSLQLLLHHGSREGSGTGDEKGATAPLPGFPLSQTPEVGLGAGALADVLRCAEVLPGSAARAGDYIYGISRRSRVGERLPYEVGGEARGLLHPGGGSERAGGRFRGGTWSFPLNLNCAGILLPAVEGERRSKFEVKGKLLSLWYRFTSSLAP